MSAGIAFDFGWSHNRASMLAGRVAALRRQANTRFAQLDNPMDAAKRAASLRNAYPWLRPQTAAQMAAYGVDPADPAVAGIAGADLARTARRGYIDMPSRRRSTAEIANARAHPLQYAMDQYAYQHRPARAEDMGIPVGHNEDYLAGLNIGPEEMTPNLARNLTQGQRPFRERFPGMAEQFATNRATFDSARRIADDVAPSEATFQELQHRSAISDPGYTPLPGETREQLPGQSRTSSLMLPGADPRQARALAQSLPGVDATLRHIRSGGETFQGIPLPTAGSPDAFRDVYLGPGRDQIEETFTREAERLDGLISGGHLPAEAEAQARARRANMNAALDMISEGVQSIGPDVSTMGIPGLPDTLSIGDVLQGPGNAIHYAARGTVRAASVAMDTIWQAGQAQFRRGLTQPSTGNTLSPSFQAGLVGAGPGGTTTSAQALQETDVGIALEHWINGEPLEQGSGFFVGLESPDAMERRQRELRTGNIGGHVITMGRYAADRVGFAPDTLPFDVASGLVDLTWMLAEPGGAAVDLAARSLQSRRLLSRIGGFTATRTLHPDRFMEAIANDTQIRQVIDHYASLDNDLDIMEARPRSMPEWAHWALADQRVVDEAATEMGDARYVEDMLANITGMGSPVPSVPLARAGTLGRAGDPLIAPAVSWRRHINRSRVAMDVPEEGIHAVDTVNPDVVADGARRHMRSMRAPEDEIARVVGRIFREGYEYPTRVRINQLERERAILEMTDMGPEARTVAHGEVVPVADRLAEIEETLTSLAPGKFIDRPTPRLNVLHDIWYKDMQDVTFNQLISSGVEPGTAKVLNKLRGDASSFARRNVEEEGAYWLRLTGDNTAVNRDLWGVLDGEPITDGSRPGFAHALAEHQGRYLPLPEDWRQLARLTRTNGFAQAMTAIFANQKGDLRWGSALADGFMNKVWKPSRLLRVAWPIRVVGEEQFRMAATGFDTAIGHPLAYWSLVMGTRQDGKMHRFLDALESGMFGDVADETERFAKIRAKLFGGSMTDDLTGTPFGSLGELQEVMNRSATSNWLIPSGAAANGKYVPYDYRRADPGLGGEMTPGAFHAWNDWFARMHTDDLLRRIARIARGDDSEFKSLDELIEAGGGPARSGDELRLGRAREAPEMEQPEFVETLRRRGLAPGGDEELTVVGNPGEPFQGVARMGWEDDATVDARLAEAEAAAGPDEVVSVNREVVRTPADDPEFVYRVVSEDDWQRIKEQGFIDSGGARNRPGEGNNIFVSLGDPHITYLTPPGGGEGTGRILKIKFNREDEWKNATEEAFADLFGNAADYNNELMTARNIPLERVESTSPAIRRTGQEGAERYRFLPEDIGGHARPGKMGQNIIARSRADLMDDPKHGALGERGATGYAERLSRGDETVNSWDDYIHSLAIRLDEMTGGEDSLLRAVADGNLDGIPLNRQNTARINPMATRKLKDKYADFMPVVVPGDKAFHDQVVGGIRAGADEFLDRTLERLYALGGAIPTDRLSRSPAFRQYYYRRAQDIMPYLTPAAQRKLIDGAQLANVPKDSFHVRLSAYIGDSENVTSPTIKSLEEAAARGTGDLTFEMADEIAKLAAIDNTRWLLYDVHKRGLFMDAMRIIFPFGEAWKEVATRWLALTAARPGTVVARAHQVQKITQAHPWEESAGPGGDPSGHGFFFENANGESVFTYPATRWFTSSMVGVPVELTGSLSGLSIMSSVGPGVGPVVQVWATFVPGLRESPQFDKWRELIFPFGMSDLNTLPVDTILSPGARRVFEGIAMGGLRGISDRIPDIPGPDMPFAEAVGDTLHGIAEGAAQVALLGGGDYEHDTGILNSLFDVMRYNVSTGRYTTDTPDNVTTLVEDSTEMTGALSIVRGLAQFSAPSAPIPEHYVEDKNGNLLMLRALTDIYRDLQAEDYTTAADTFLTRYGPNLALTLQAKTVPRTSLIPSTKKADQWLRDHPRFQDTYPTTYGLLVPDNHGPDSEFDFEAYNRAKATGATRTLGHELRVEDLVKLANDRAASIIYDQIEADLLADPQHRTESGNLNEEAQHYMSTTVTEELMDSHYGFRQDDLIRGPSTQDLQRLGMDEIDTALNDNDVDAEFRAPLRAYMEAHHQMLDLARSAEYDNAANYYESMATRPLRDYMRYTVAPQIRDQIPRGTGLRSRWDVIWDRLFDRIMLNDRAEEQRAMAVAG